jgi:enoyl-CoA hydratase/carnithine racemase
MSGAPEAGVQVERRGPVALVTFSNGQHNFMSTELLRDVVGAFVALDADPGVRVTVLRSLGRNFCAGADLGSGGPPDRDTAVRFYEEAARLMSVGKPIVCAVQGAAVGAGLGLALAADFRIAAHSASFTANFVKLGFHPGFGITHLLPRVIGPQRAAQMCLTGRRVRVEEALPWALADEAVAEEELETAAVAFAVTIAENAPLAVQRTRATLRGRLAKDFMATVGHELDEQLALTATEDYAEGVRAVRERRPGVFVGR